jgi:hypothetical protein
LFSLKTILFSYLSKDETDKTRWPLDFQGENIHSAGGECLLFRMPLPKLAWRQGGHPEQGGLFPQGNFRPANTSRKVFGVAFYKRRRFAPLSKSGSRRLEKPINTYNNQV